MTRRPLSSQRLPTDPFATRNGLSPRNGLLPWLLDGLALVFAVAIVAGAVLAPQIA